MLIKLVAIILMIAGVAGLILPIVPGVLLLTIGAMLFYKDRLAQIRQKLPEKIPPSAAAIYSYLIPKRLSPFYDTVARDTRVENGWTVLDIGCGPGTLVARLALKNPSAKFIGIDSSEKMVEIALKNRVKGPGLRVQGKKEENKLENVEYWVMDAKNLAFADSSMDLVISTGSLHHWKDPVKVLNEIYRCLKGGAEALIYDGLSDASNADINRCVKKIMGIFPTPGFVRYMLHIHGFTQEEYYNIINPIISSSLFGSCVFENSGLMMRLRLKKTAEPALNIT